jgi:hypothetical protein
MNRILVITLILAAVFAVVMAQPSLSEAWHGHSSFFVAAGPPFYGFPIGLGYTTFSGHSAFSIGFSGFWPGYYYPYYAAPVYYPAPVYYEPVYYRERHYRGRPDDRDWVTDAEEFLRGGR